MKNNKFIFSCITVCCMMIFSFNGVFGQGTLGEYPGAGVGFDSGCGYPNAGNNEPGFTDMDIPGNACGSAFDVTFGPWIETATGFDIGGFELNNFDVDTEASYGIRLFYGPQDNCCTICLDAMLDLSQNQPCGTFGPQPDLSVFGYPVPTNYGGDIFGDDVIPYENMCPNTEYFVTYQFISATDVDLTDPDGDLCAMDDALITNFGTMSAVQTLVAPGTRDPIVINSATVALAGAADCGADVVLDYNIDITSGCVVDFGTCSKGLEYEFRATLSCGDGTTLNISSGSLLNDPDECYAGTSTVPGSGVGQITLGTVAEVCAIATCDPNASIELYAIHTFCEADDINGDGSGVDEAVASISLTDILAAYGDAGAMCCPSDVPGCTDPCAPNYDATATIDDGTCEPYNDTCNADCTAGPFGGTWDAATCACINETTPVSGCTDPTANNYDPNANCDDGTCTNAVPGCTDQCAPNYNPDATTDDGTCDSYDDTCNADCTAGSFGGTWDASTCACINETTPVSGCTDPTADNYDPAANCDDGSCMTAPVCSISASATSTCNNNDTPDDISDDVTTYTVTVTGTDTGAGFTASVAPDAGALTYGTPLTYTVIGGGGLSVVFTDDTDATCTATVSRGSGCIDIGEVPTVGEWGLIILGLMMSITAIVGIRQRREEEVTA